MCFCALLDVVGTLWQEALLDAAVQEAASQKKRETVKTPSADHEPEAETDRDQEGEGEEEDVELMKLSLKRDLMADRRIVGLAKSLAVLLYAPGC